MQAGRFADNSINETLSDIKRLGATCASPYLFLLAKI